MRECGVRSAERGTASLHCVALTRIDIKCGARNAERGTTSLRYTTLTRNIFSFFLIFTCVKPLIDFGFWMRYEQKKISQGECTRRT